MNNLLYLDCDGVLADFDKGFQDLFDMDPRSYEDTHGHDVFWKQLRDAESFFYNLPPMPDAHELWNAVKHLNPIILTGCPEGGWAEVQKHRWIRQHFGRRVSMITCASREKSLFCEPGDIIVDDWPRHQPKWEARGGIWVHHESAEDSIRQLIKLGVLRDPNWDRPDLEPDETYCPPCNGTGLAGERESCQVCEGSGKLPLVHTA